MWLLLVLQKANTWKGLSLQAPQIQTDLPDLRGTVLNVALKHRKTALNQRIPGWVCYLQSGAVLLRSLKSVFGTRSIGLVWKTVRKRSEALRSEVDFAQFVLCFTKLVLLK